MPNCLSPISASPLSLRRIRLYFTRKIFIDKGKRNITYINLVQIIFPSGKDFSTFVGVSSLAQLIMLEFFMGGNKITEALEFHNYMNEQNIIMSFMGNLTHQVTTSLLKNLKDNMSATNIDVTTQKRLYGVIVECLDNISKHWAALDIQKLLGRSSPPIFMLSRKDDYFYIVTGNHVVNEHIESLSAKIEFVNTLDKIGLQDFYRETLAKESPLERDDAGLGIIDIALKSGNKLEYIFKPITSTVAFYVIQAKIKI